jgi:outer membrane lipoprotein-sorting protein
MFGDVLRSEGFLYYLSPGKIRWEFVKPYGSLTIMQESGEVEKYDIIDGRAVRVETGARQVLAEVLTQIVNWQKGNVEQANDEFRLSMYKKDTGFKMVLTPLSRSVAKILSQIEFEIDGTSFLVHSVTLRENENDYTVIRFSEQELNRQLPDELFNLEKPLLINTKK